MFDIGWSELLVIAVVTILVVGPKELPGLLRTIGKTIGNLRRMAGDLQGQFNEALKEAELDEVAKTIGDARKLNPSTAVKDAVKKQLSLDDLSEDLSSQMADVKEDFEKTIQSGSEVEVSAKSGATDKPAASAGSDEISQAPVTDSPVADLAPEAADTAPGATDKVAETEEDSQTKRPIDERR